jgi:tetratricopeptide (TPR) repeat protein
VSENLPTTLHDAAPSRLLTVLRGPVWSLRVEGQRVSIVLQGAPLPGGAELSELVIRLPHVSFPFDFREGIERFRHHRGHADGLELGVDARVLLDWLHRVSGGRLGGNAHDDSLVLSGRTDEGARYTVRARLVADPDPTDDEPTLTLSLYQVRVYGQVGEPWPLLASRVIDLLPADLVVDRTLTTARLRIVRPALAFALSALGWKLPDVTALRARGVELREGRLVARFRGDDADLGPMLTLDTMAETALRGAFERFVEDLELKRHHGQVDRLLATQQVREALAEIYRALDGPPQPGFLAERLIGICASQPILHDEGERVCRDLLRIAPSYEPALCGLASIAFGRGRSEEAAVQLERLAAVLTAPADREDATAADLTVAEILRESASDEARAALSRVLERSPDHEEALEMLIGLSDAEGDLRATLPLYKRLLFAARSRDRTRDAGLRLARHALERDQPEDARVFLRVVLEASPDDLEAQLALAEVERLSGAPAEAARILDGALRQIPPTDAANAVRVIARLARLALDPMNDLGRARRVLWRAVDLAPIDDEPALVLARLALDAREPVLAERYLEFIGAASPRWAEAQALRAEGFLARGDARGALQAVLAVLDVTPEDATALALLERCTPDLGQRELLVNRLAQSAARVPAGPARARVLHQVGELYASMNLRWDAIAPWEQALEEAPGGPEAAAVAARLLDLYAEFGMWPRHQELGKARLPREHEPAARVVLLVRLGRVALDELDDALEARPFLEEAVRLAPRHVVALELLRRTLETLEQGIALIGVLSRLETLTGDEAARDACRVRLAELQLDGLGAPGQARATLGRVTAARARDPRVDALRRRLGMPVEAAPVAAVTLGPSSAASRPVPAAPPRYEDALDLADRGERGRALSLLDRILTVTPDHVPAQELRLILEADAEGLSPTRPAADDPEGPPTMPVRRPSVVGMVAVAQPAVAASRVDRRVATQEFEALPASAVRQGSELAALRRATSGPAVDAALDVKIDEADRLDAAMQAAEGRLRGGDTAGARQALEEALEVDPDYVPALEILADVLRATDDHPERARVLARLLDTVFDADQSATYLRELGHVLADHLRDAEGALERWLRYLSWRPLDVEVFERVKRRLEADGEDEVLADLYERRAEAWEDAEAGGVDPMTAWRRAATALRHAAGLRLRAGDAVLAVATAERGLALVPGEPELLETLVRARVAAGDVAGATAAMAHLAPLLLEGPLKDELLVLIGQPPPD